MKPSFYFNIQVHTAKTAMGPSGTSITALSRALAVVHGTATASGIVFAAAFPGARTGAEVRHPGTVLRVFSGAQDHCVRIAEAIEANTFLQGYVHVGRVRPVPQGLTESVEYRLFRIGARKSFAATQGKRREGGGEWGAATRVPAAVRRERRVQQGAELPFLRMISASNGEQFSLRFETIPGKAPPSAECSPNSYGLSTETRRFALPHLVDDATPWSLLQRRG